MNPRNNKENLSLPSNKIKIHSKPFIRSNSLQNQLLPKINFSLQSNSNFNPKSIQNQQKNTPQFAPIHNKQTKINHLLKCSDQNLRKPKKLRFNDSPSNKVMRFKPLVQRSNKIPDQFINALNKKRKSLENVIQNRNLKSQKLLCQKQGYFNQWYSKKLQKIQAPQKNKNIFKLTQEQVQKLKPFFSDKVSRQVNNDLKQRVIKML